MINTSSFNRDGQYKGTLRIPAELQEIYLKITAGNTITNLPALTQKSGGVIINFGDDYSCSPPDTIEPTQKSHQFQLKEEKQLKAVTNIIGNGEFNINNFGVISNWNTVLSIDQKWHLIKNYNSTMEWFSDDGNGVIRTPMKHGGYYSYNGGASQ